MQEEDVINKQKIDCAIICDELKAVYQKHSSDREKQLTQTLEDMKVVRQAYHGNVMVGNHTVIVLKNYKKLTIVVSDRVSYDKYNEIFKLFSDAMKLMMARKFLSDKEVGELCELLNQFGEKFPVFFPQRNITRKIHEVIFTVPRFVRIYRTIGMLSEQEAESKHASINAELCSLACVRNHAERLKLVIEHEELRSYVNKGLMKPRAQHVYARIVQEHFCVLHLMERDIVHHAIQIFFRYICFLYFIIYLHYHIYEVKT